MILEKKCWYLCSGENNKMAGFLEDSKGNKSSKRLCGIILVGFSLTLALILFIISIYKPIGDANTALRIVEVLSMVGGGLLGVGAIENAWGRKL